MDIIEILIKCPRDIQIEIEEYCINQGVDFSKYFLKLHDIYKKTQEKSENSCENSENWEKNSPKSKKTRK